MKYASSHRRVASFQEHGENDFFDDDGTGDEYLLTGIDDKMKDSSFHQREYVEAQCEEPKDRYYVSSSSSSNNHCHGNDDFNNNNFFSLTKLSWTAPFQSNAVDALDHYFMEAIYNTDNRDENNKDDDNYSFLIIEEELDGDSNDENSIGEHIENSPLDPLMASSSSSIQPKRSSNNRRRLRHSKNTTKDTSRKQRPVAIASRVEQSLGSIKRAIKNRFAITSNNTSSSSMTQALLQKRNNTKQCYQKKKSTGKNKNHRQVVNSSSDSSHALYEVADFSESNICWENQKLSFETERDGINIIPNEEPIKKFVLSSGTARNRNSHSNQHHHRRQPTDPTVNTSSTLICGNAAAAATIQKPKKKKKNQANRNSIKNIFFLNRWATTTNQDSSNNQTKKNTKNRKSMTAKVADNDKDDDHNYNTQHGNGNTNQYIANEKTNNTNSNHNRTNTYHCIDVTSLPNEQSRYTKQLDHMNNPAAAAATSSPVDDVVYEEHFPPHMWC